MRYILDDNGYVESVGYTEIVCNNKTCTAYTGNVPDGYSSIEEWATKANIRAYKVVSGQLVYDSAKDTALQKEWARQGLSYANDDYFASTLSSKVTMSNTAYTVIPFNHAYIFNNGHGSFSFDDNGSVTITNEIVKKVRVYASMLDDAWGEKTRYLSINKNGNVVKRVYAKNVVTMQIESEIPVELGDVITITYYSGTTTVIASGDTYTQFIVSVA